MKKHRGFTLVELMIVVLIIGILSAIAVPGYRQYVLRVARTDAKRDLLSNAQTLERCFTRFNAYDNAACVILVPAGPVNNPESTYALSAQLTPNNFLLTAAPINGQVDDTECGSLTVDQAGRQNITGTGVALSCWSSRRS
jgi:type IV pilus assembly protein PilE